VGDLVMMLCSSRSQVSPTSPQSDAQWSGVHPSSVSGVLKQRWARPLLLLNAQWSCVHPSGVSNMLKQKGG
jgi:hypothetical protein